MQSDSEFGDVVDSAQDEEGDGECCGSNTSDLRHGKRRARALKEGRAAWTRRTQCR